MSSIRRNIAAKLLEQPRYKMTFKAVKGYVDGMIADGEVEACAPLGLKAKNMVRLTEAGRAKYEARGDKP